MRNLILFIPIFVISCAINRNSTISEKEIVYLTYEVDCGKTLSEVKRVWKNYESHLCCLYNKDLIERLKVNLNCFRGFTKEEVKSYFGSPMGESQSQLAYSIYSECEPFNGKNLRYTLIFYFICDRQPTDKVMFCVLNKPNGNILE